jgi:hypothetical protein
LEGHVLNIKIKSSETFPARKSNAMKYGLSVMPKKRMFPMIKKVNSAMAMFILGLLFALIQNLFLAGI